VKRTRRLRLPRGPRDTLLWLGAAGVIALAAVSGFAIGSKRLSAERAVKASDLEIYQRAIDATASEKSSRAKIDRELVGFVDRTLGSDPEETDSALRARLNRIGEDTRLSDLRVSTGSPTRRQTPAKRTLPKPKDLRELDDFWELPATVTGEGTIEQALSLVHRIDIEPWMKRLDAVRLDQLKDGERIKVTVKLTTLWLPTRKGKGDLKPSDSDLATFERLRALVTANPFRVPQLVKPAPPAAVATAPAPPPPTGFPYEQWKLTAVVAGPLGPEAWLRNAANGEHRELAPGQQLGDAVFVGYERDVAEFKEGESRFRVQVGGAMSERAAVPAT